jgi:hypothetical protein
MSWLFSQVLVVEYLGASCLDGERSALSSGNHTQLAYLPQDKMTDFSRLSRFGMMFKPLTESLGEELLMLYRAGFHAKTLVQQEKAQELTENGQECGGRWQGLLARYDPNTHSLRTVQCSLLEDLNESLQTWPKWGLMRNGECFQQPMLEQTISENEFGYVPNNENFFHTPNTTGLDGGSNSRKALKKRMEQWPTPDANCGQRGTQPNWTPKRKSGHTAQYTINQAVRDKFPTPTCHNSKEGAYPAEFTRKTPTLATHAGGKLNPMWVEWLMGWPLGWTDLKPLETDKYHFVQQQPGTSLKED